MGWTGSLKLDSQSTKDWLIAEFTSETDDHKWELTDVSMRGSTAYGIYKSQDKKTGIVVAEGFVILTRKEGDWIYYKEMGESVHPFYYDASKKLLDKLDALYPPINDRAMHWRAKCREMAVKKATAKLVDGDVVKFAQILSFGNFKEDTFQFEKWRGRDSFRSVNHNVLCRIPKWKTRNFTKVEKND